MPEELFCLVFAGGSFALAIVFGLLLDARGRIRRLARRVGELERERVPPRSADEGLAPEPGPERAQTPPPPGPEPPRAARVPVSHEPSPASPEPEPDRAPATPSPASAAASEPREAALVTALKRIEWERWIGIRGAAVAGGILLALAGVFLFREAITRGWLTPPSRLAFGGVLGVTCLVTGARLRRRRFDFVPGALEGAGLVALYASIWAADERYHYIALTASLPLMALVTALGCFLSIRHGSRIAITLALVGGFATPLLLGTDPEQPLTRFGYVLLLDLGLLFVGRQRGWGWIGLAGLLGTSLFEGLWVFSAAGAQRYELSLVWLGLFAAIFATAGWYAVAGDGKLRAWLPAQASGVLFPFVFLGYFAQVVQDMENVWPLAAVLFVLSVAGLLVSWQQTYPTLARGAIAAAVLVTGVWALRAPTTSAVAWELALVGLGLLAAPWLALELWNRRSELDPGGLEGTARVAALAWAVFHVALCTRMADEVSIVAPSIGLLGTAAVLVRLAFLSGQGRWVIAAAAALSAGHAAHYLGGGLNGDGSPLDLAPAARLVYVIALAVGLVALAGRRSLRFHRAAWHGAALVLTPFALFLIAGRDGELEKTFFLGAGVFALRALLMLIAGRLRGAAWLFAALLAPLPTQVFWLEEAERLGSTRVWIALASTSLLPLFVGATSARIGWRRAAFLAAGLALLVAELGFARTWYDVHGTTVESAPHVLLALIALATTGLLWRAGRAGAEGKPFAGALWFANLCVAFVSFGAVLEISRQEGMLLAALLAVGGACTAWGARRLLAGEVSACEPDRTVTGRGACAMAGLLALIAVEQALDGGHYAHSHSFLLNEFGLAHLIALVACGLIVWLLRGEEAVPHAARLLHAIPGLAAVVVVFVWINLAILNHYTEGERLHFGLERMQERDLATSIAWASYAVGLLVLGKRLSSKGLRWVSLLLVFAAILKVFLRDLGDLEGLYFVGSLAGVAVSLMLVSVIYQRFVFKEE